MRPIWKVVQIFILTVIGLGILILSLWAFPQWMTNKKLISYGLRTFAPEFEVPLENLKLQLTNTSFWEKDFSLHSKDRLCMKWDESSICFENLDLKIHLIFPKLLSSSVEFLNVRARGQKIKIPSSWSQQNSDDSAFNINQVVNLIKDQILFVSNQSVEDVSLEFKDIEIEYEEKNYIFNLNFNDDGPLNASLLIKNSLQAEVFVEQWRDTEVPWKLNVTVESQSVIRKIDGKGAFNRDEMLSSLDLKLNEFLKKGNAKQMSLSGNGVVNLQSTESTLIELGKVKFDRAGVPAQWKFTSCQVALTSNIEESTLVSCPDSQVILNQAAYKKTMQLPKEINLKILPEKFKLNLTAIVREAKLVGDIQEEVAPVEISLDEFKALQKSYDLEARGKIELKYRQDALVPLLNDLEVNFRSEKIRDLIVAIGHTKWAIPAPINQFNGRTRLKITQSPKRENRFLLASKVNLRGPEKMRFVSSFEGEFQFDRKFKFVGRESFLKMIIDKAYLYIPDFDPIAGVPSVAKDKRLVEKKVSGKKDQAKIELPIHLSIETSSNKSIRIYYKLFEPYLTMGFSCQLKEKGMNWVIDGNENFKISYLKRKVTVQSINIEQPYDSEAPVSLNLQLGFEASNYEVVIKIRGTTDKPQVSFSSQPYLADEDIISLLLYNRTRGELTSFESENVGGTQAAITDRAVGLFGLWLFASTPVESVSYNSATNTYQAQLSLPGKLRLSVGTDWEAGRFVGLGRRVGGGWMIMTEYELDDSGSVGNIYLQKEFFY